MKSRVASGNLTWHHNEIATVDQPLVGLSLGSCLVGGWGEVGWVTVRNAGAPRTYYLSSKFLPPKGKAEVLSASGEMILISKFQRLGHIFPYHLREKTTILVSIPEVSLSWFFFFFKFQLHCSLQNWTHEACAFWCWAPTVGFIHVLVHSGRCPLSLLPSSPWCEHPWVHNWWTIVLSPFWGCDE